MAEPFLMRALLAGLGLAVVAAPLGCFVVWRRMAYYGEAVAQAGLIGIAVGLALSLNLTASVLVVTLAVSVLLVVLSRQQLVPFDSLLGLLAHAALAVGVIAASLVRGPQLDLMAFLFGDIFAISATDLKWIYLGGALALAALVYVWRPLLSLSVHEDLAAAEGTPVERVKFIFVLVLALVVAIAIKIVGVLLDHRLPDHARRRRPAAVGDARADGPVRGHLRLALGGARAVPVGVARYAGRPLDRAGAGPVLRRRHLPHRPPRPAIAARLRDSRLPAFRGEGQGEGQPLTCMPAPWLAAMTHVPPRWETYAARCGDDERHAVVLDESKAHDQLPPPAPQSPFPSTSAASSSAATRRSSCSR